MRKTTTLKTAKFVSHCQFATINFRALAAGAGSILLPTGDQMEKENKIPTTSFSINIAELYKGRRKKTHGILAI